jgi:hypothetical protein
MITASKARTKDCRDPKDMNFGTFNECSMHPRRVGASETASSCRRETESRTVSTDQRRFPMTSYGR